MKKFFFDEDDNLRINEAIFEHPVYKQVMADGEVSSDELVAQGEKVLALFHKLEEVLSDEQKQLVGELVIESNILNTLSKIYSNQLSLD